METIPIKKTSMEYIITRIRDIKNTKIIIKQQKQLIEE